MMSFQEVVTEDDFSGKAKETTFKWGVHDEFMFERLFEDMTKASHPFMYMAGKTIPLLWPTGSNAVWLLHFLPIHQRHPQ